jgi:hypothetical protein
MTTDITTIEQNRTENARANRCCSTSNSKEPTMSDIHDAALDFLEPVFPEALIFLKSEKGRQAHNLFMQADEEFGNRYDVAYHAAVSILWRAKDDFQEAGDFLNSRDIRSMYFDRVGEEIRKADLEVERADRDEAERRTCLKEKLDQLASDGVLTNEERKELDRAPFLGGGNDDLPW